MKRFKGGSISSHETHKFVEQSYLKNSQRDDAVGAFQLDRALSDDRAAVYFNPASGQTLICNRGTAPTASDWYQNYKYATGSYDDSDRLAHAKAKQDEVIQKYGKVDTNIGHSQSAIITRKLNEQGKTGEIINVNGASMFEKQANNETRIRSSGDVVSAMATMAPSRKRNHTIKAESWNPLTEHSANILERLSPITVFGKGFAKTYYY